MVRASDRGRRAGGPPQPVPTSPWRMGGPAGGIHQRLHDAPGLLDAVLALETCAVALHRGMQQHLVRRRDVLALPAELLVEADQLRLRGLASLRLQHQAHAGRRIEPDDQLVGLGRAAATRVEAEARRAMEHEPQLGLGGLQVLAGPDEEGHTRPAPVVDLQPHRGVGLGRRVRGDSVDLPVPVVLAADVVRRIGRRHRVEDGEQRVLERRGIAGARRLHRRRPDHLHEMVHHDVAQRADRVVEVAAVVDAEVLGHRDLDARDLVAVPDRLEDRVREPQVEDLRESQLPEVVVDPVQLALVEVVVHLVRERAGGLQIVAERLLDHDAGGLDEACAGQAFHDGAEQERRDLEVEDRGAGVLQPHREALERRRVGEVARQVGEAGGEPVEHRRVEGLTACQDRLAGTLAQVVVRPVVDGDADDRAGQQPARLEAVERVQRHHLRQVAGDAEHHEDVGRLLGRGAGCGDTRARSRCGGHAAIVRLARGPVITRSG